MSLYITLSCVRRHGADDGKRKQEMTETLIAAVWFAIGFYAGAATWPKGGRE
jgi:hypothetical protein